MTADFGNFVSKNDEKRKTKDEMNLAHNALQVQLQYTNDFISTLVTAYTKY